jgi:flagellin
MALTVRTNTASTFALNSLNRTSRALQGSFERIASGKRIASGADDAAGLGVAENLKADAASATVAARNANDGISMIAIAEGSSSEVTSLLTRARELAIQASSDTLGSTERGYIQTEYAELAEEIDRIAATTEFNGKFLTDGSLTQVDVQVGIQSSTNDIITIDLGQLDGATLGITGVALSTVTAAQSALSTIDTAIDTVSGYRATLGSVENRLNSALNNLGTYEVNTTEAESRIRDADFGYETALLAQNQILQQAGVSVLSQANQINQGAVSLLQ